MIKSTCIGTTHPPLRPQNQKSGVSEGGGHVSPLCPMEWNYCKAQAHPTGLPSQQQCPTDLQNYLQNDLQNDLQKYLQNYVKHFANDFVKDLQKILAQNTVKNQQK